MTKEEALKIIKEENLVRYRFFDNSDPDMYEVGIIKKEGTWEVYCTDERGYFFGKRGIFSNESDALDSFIFRLRANSDFLKSPYA